MQISPFGSMRMWHGSASAFTLLMCSSVPDAALNLCALILLSLPFSVTLYTILLSCVMARYDGFVTLAH